MPAIEQSIHELPLQESSYSVWNNKHRLKDINLNPIDLDVKGTFRRCAKALASVEIQDKEKWEEIFYNIISRCYPGGRILANAGAQEYKPEATLINCVVSSNIKDSLSSILDVLYENGVTLKTGAGIGFCFSLIRPSGSYVNGVNADTSGPLSFADIYDSTCQTIKSAGGRRGSMMFTFHVSHPDIFKVIKAKREKGKLRNFNITILMTNKFINAVKNDEDWKLYFPLHKNENIDCETIYKSWPVEESHHIVREEDGKVLCKVFKVIKAREIWNAIIESNYNYAEPGFLLIDKINSENNLYFCEDIIATNPSLAKDTMVLTDKGIVPINELEDKLFKLKTPSGNWATGSCWLSNDKEPIYEIKLNNHQIIKASAEHKWAVKDPETGIFVKSKTADLKPGDILLSNKVEQLDFESKEVYNNGHAFYIGANLETLNDKDIERLSKIYPNIVKRQFPQFIWSSSPEFIFSFIQSYLIKNSTVTDRYDDFIITKSKHKDIILNVVKLISFYGINLKITQDDIHWIVLMNRDQFAALNSIKSRSKLGIFKDKLVNTTVNTNTEAVVESSLNIKQFDVNIESVIKTDYTEPVWDIFVNDDDHTFSINWAFTGNCGEQPLPPNANCLLGSINLVKYVINPFSDKPSFNFKQLEEDTYIFNRALDNVVEISNLPLDIQVKELYRKRRHGLGYLGLGSALNMMKIRYGSDESVELTTKITAIIATTTIIAGINLAKEKGPAPIMLEEFEITEKMLKKSKALKSAVEEGKYQIGQKLLGKELIIYSGYLSRFSKEIKDAIKEHGLRYSHGTSIAPTGTMALGIGNNVSNGIEPTFEHEAIRNIIEPGKKTKKDMVVYSYESLLYKTMFGKDAPIPEYFVSVDDLTPIDHIKIQAAAQPYIDSSISKCIAKGTRIITKNGLIKIEDIIENNSEGFIDISDKNLFVLSSTGFNKITQHYYGGVKKTKIITFDIGIKKEISYEHKLLTSDGWIKATDLSVGDNVLYKTATKVEFNKIKSLNYWRVIGFLNNKNTQILENSIVNSDIPDINNNNILYNFKKVFKDFDIESFNDLSKDLINEIKAFKLSLDIDLLSIESLGNRRGFFEEYCSKISNTLFAPANNLKEARLISEIMFVTGINSAIIEKEDGINVVQLSDSIINSAMDSHERIPCKIIKIENGENEVYDITVKDTHEYLLHGIISHNTINCPTDINIEDFSNIYMNAFEYGLKSATTFRFNPAGGFQGVIVKKSDLDNTKYEITLENGEKKIFLGSDKIIYHGEETTIANLYDALSEGHFGKF